MIEETLRLYPAGWVGTRVTAAAVSFEGIEIPAKTLVMYSPWLTHHDPALWADPMRFRPARFTEPLPAWGFIPFAAGERSCLGAHLARLILRTVATEFAAGSLTRSGHSPGVRAGVTLAPNGPLPMSLDAAVERARAAGSASCASGERGEEPTVERLSYLAVLGACLICVAPLAIIVRRTMRTNRRRLGLSVLVTFVIFTGWDLYAIHAHQWSYARARTVGWLLPGRLPIEEALFFVVIPLCMILTYETVQQVLQQVTRPAITSEPSREDAP